MQSNEYTGSLLTSILSTPSSNQLIEWEMNVPPFGCGQCDSLTWPFKKSVTMEEEGGEL